jgi:hypothetical protein
MSTNDERTKDAEALAVLDAAAKTLYSEFATTRNPNPEVLLLAARAHLAARLDSLAGENARLVEDNENMARACVSTLDRAERAERERDAMVLALRQAADSLPLPKISPMKLDCYKAGARAMIVALNSAYADSLAAKPKGEL